MESTHRDVLSFASVGALGAATLALGAYSKSAAAGIGGSVGGKGPAIEGPYLHYARTQKPALPNVP